MNCRIRHLWLPAGTLLVLALIIVGLYPYWPTISYQLLRWQLQFHRELGAMLRASVNQDPVFIASLLATSFAYGVFHAAGPGHGKMVLSTYLTTQPSQLRHALQLSSGAALLQALVAIALIGTTSWLLGMTARQAQALGVWFEKGSFLLVALMGGYLALRALRQGWQLYQENRRSPCRVHRILSPAERSPRLSLKSGFQPSATAPDSNPAPCGCGHAHVPTPSDLEQAIDWRSQLGILLSMGMRPCGGALLILVLAKVMGLFWLGILATLAMAAGTALTVALLAIISQRARHLAQRLLKNSHRTHSWALLGEVVALCGGLILIGVGLSLMLAPTSLLLPR